MQGQQTEIHAQPFCERSLFLILELLVWKTSRGLLRCSLGTEAGGLNLFTFPLPHSESQVSPRKKLVYSQGTQIFAAATQGTSLITWLW